MANNQIKTRIIHKHDTEANWNLATNFIPKQGEIIVYDKDSTYSYERFKIGDGTTNVINLPFASNVEPPDWNAAEGEDAHILNRTHWTEPGIIELMPTVTYPVEDEIALIMTQIPAEIVEGANLIAIYNGTEYPVTVAAFNFEGADTIGFGNYGAVIGSNPTSEPFAFIKIPDSMASSEGIYAAIVPLDGVTSCLFGLKGEGEVVHKLDEKYFPESVKVPTITITKKNNKYSVDYPFQKAWEMNENMLQSAIIYIDEDSQYPQRCAAASVSKFDSSSTLGFYFIQITVEPWDDSVQTALRKLCITWGSTPDFSIILIDLEKDLVLQNLQDIASSVYGRGLYPDGSKLMVYTGDGLYIPTHGEDSNNVDKVTLKTMSETEMGGAKVGEGLQVVNGALKVKDSIRTVQQSLSDTEKSQARANINAASQTDIDTLIGDIPVADQINTAISNNEATEDEIIELLASLDMFPVITDADGSILTDENDAILLV